MFQKRRFLAQAIVLAISIFSFPSTGSLLSEEPPDEKGLEFFETSIRPLLLENCSKCHSVAAKKLRGGLLLDSRWGWSKGGDSGAVIVPGNPVSSVLLKHVRHDTDFAGMPPDTKLKPGQILALTRWIEMGAPDPRARKERAADTKTFDLEERKNWWSLHPVKDVDTPQVRDADWPLVAYDRFVLADLEAKGWKPAEMSGKRTWLRRLTFDITGLPPTPEEIDDFLADASPKSYETVVDRLLDSVRYGEHWARKWMDVVRYGETKAFEQDYTLPHAYKFRDYLIKVFNDDVPYDRFVMESLAGDLLEPRIDPKTGENESIKGPGFVHLTSGQHGPPDLHGDEARIFADIINVIGKAYLGTTIACARCHDHKFDAVTTADYYSLYGIMASSRLDNQNALSTKILSEHRSVLARQQKIVRGELGRIWLEDLAGVEGDLIAVFSEKTRSERQKRWRTAIENAGDPQRPEHALYPIHVAWVGRSRESFSEFWDEKLAEAKILSSRAPTMIGGLEPAAFGSWRSHGFGFESSVRESGCFIIPRAGPAAVRSFVGDSVAAGVFSPRVGGSFMSPLFELDGTQVRVRVKGRGSRVNLIVQHYELVGKGPTTNGLTQRVENDEWHWIGFRTNLWKGLRAYIDVQLNGGANLHNNRAPHVYKQNEDAYIAVDRAYQGEDPVPVLVSPSWSLLAPMPNSPRAAAGKIAEHLRAVVGRWRDSKSQRCDGKILQALVVGGLLGRSMSQSPALEDAVVRFRELRSRVPQPNYVRTLSEGEGRDEPVYIRGNHKNPAKTPNPRHFLDGLDGIDGLDDLDGRDGKEFGSEGSGRLDWARRVASRKNPLTARVMANRIWYHMFGRGVVFSVDDFGRMGRAPSHPELLDRLAADFASDGWSVKALVRKLALSATYRMSSHPSSEALLEDPDNVWLQHMPVRRLAAEAIRDTLLSVSGRIDFKMYGQGVPDSQHESLQSRSSPRRGPMDGDGRRSVYLELRRSYLPSFLTAFDMPNASTPFGRRHVTSVPAQSLAMMNSPFVMGQAEFWARRILQSKDRSFADRIDAMHLRAFGRPLEPGDMDWARRAFTRIGGELGLSFEQAVVNQDVWKNFCHIMLNRKELIYVF